MKMLEKILDCIFGPKLPKSEDIEPRLNDGDNHES